MKSNLQINDIVLSSNFGLGKIVGFEKLNGSAQEFVVIESLEKKIKLMAPLVQKLSFRKLSTSEDLEERLETLKNKDGKREFQSKKERITYFKDRSHEQDLDSIMQTIAELRELRDRGTVENKIYETLVESVRVEVEQVMQIEAKKAEQILENSLGGRE